MAVRTRRRTRADPFGEATQQRADSLAAKIPEDAEGSEKRLAAATAELQERQQVKASLSERLFGLLLESEEMRTEKLQSVAQELEHIEGTPAKAGDGAKT